jgi:hypothetical protein
LLLWCLDYLQFLYLCCFCNRDITQSRCVRKPFHGFIYFEGCYVIVCLRCYVKYLPFDTFVRTCNENCNGIRKWMCGHIDMMSWIYLCGTLFHEDVVLWIHMRIIQKKVLVVNCRSTLMYKLLLITRLEHECKLMSMSIWCNVNVGIWKYNIMGMCIEYPSHGNVDLWKLYLFDAMIRKGT